jgi:dipeptidyl-peptidase III
MRTTATHPQSSKQVAFICTILVSIGLVCTAFYYFKQGHSMTHLDHAPHHIDTYAELAIVYNDRIPEQFNKLDPAERIFIYYLFRASLPGNRIATDQLHRHGLAIREIFDYLHKNHTKLTQLYQASHDTFENINIPKLLQEAHTYLVYIVANHGQYFQREHAEEKRTPARLGLGLLTLGNIRTVLLALNNLELAQKLESLDKTLFDAAYESTCTVTGSIEASGSNFYSKDFTDADYQALTEEARSRLNSSISISKTSERKPLVEIYSVGKKYSPELEVACFWLEKALTHTSQHPKHFDEHFIKSIEHLITFLKTGDEEYFKKHSIAWLQSKSRIDYCFGFIETYNDPKNQRGLFQAEATIKAVDMDSLSKALPAIEAKLPVPDTFKRDVSGKGGQAIPNASINVQIFGAGGLGPLYATAAYCLPNYEEIRSQFGSKQIIYPASPSLGRLVNPALATRLNYFKEVADWLDEHDKHGSFLDELWDIHCILHETLGHGSGKLAQHVFKEGDPLIIGCKQYALGETIQVTHSNLPEFLAGYEATIEELRAEIIALYTSIHHIDELAKQGLLAHWYQLLGKKELQKWLIIKMADMGLTRQLQQSDNATEIAGDHARANTTIMHYLIDHGGLKMTDQRVVVDDKPYTVVGLVIQNFDKAVSAVTKLMQEVQHIKSTGDGLAARDLIETYGKPIRNKEYFKILKENERTVVGNLRARVFVYPQLVPIKDASGALIDIAAQWPHNFFEQHEEYLGLEMKTE